MGVGGQLKSFISTCTYLGTRDIYLQFDEKWGYTTEFACINLDVIRIM